MLYPIYDYYNLSSLSLEEIIVDYSNNFYLRNYGRNKLDKVRQKVINSSKIAAIDAFSIQQKVVPNYVDFCSAINEVFWFAFQSNKTQALATLIAAYEWAKRVNEMYHFGSDDEVRDKALGVFKKYDIYEEMTKEQYDKMTNPRENKNPSEDDENYEENKNKATLSDKEIGESVIKDSLEGHFNESEDSNGKDNNFDYYKGYEDYEDCGPINISISEWHEYMNNAPIPLSSPITKDDYDELGDDLFAILAEGATNHQSKIMMELLLQRRQKTPKMIEVENVITSFIKEKFDSTLKYISEKKSTLEESDANDLLKDDEQQLYDAFKKNEDYVKYYKLLANKYGFCCNIILREQLYEALDKTFEMYS